MKIIEALISGIDPSSVNSIKFDRSHRGVCWVNMSIKTAFLGIPKCGNTGLRQQLNLEAETMNVEEIPDDFFLFTVIRDPIKRFVSAYIEVVQDCKTYPGGRFNHDLELSSDKIDFLKCLMADNNCDDYSKFTTYLSKIEEWGFFEPHCVPQTIYLTDNEGKFHQNILVFRLRDLSELEYHMDRKFVKDNKSENPALKKRLNAYVSSNISLRSKIQELYKQDLILWNNWD